MQGATDKSDGTVWAWGKNRDGQLGGGSEQRRSSPVRSGSLTNMVAVGAGDDHSLAVRSDDTVWAWGANGPGQLGDGTTRARTSPMQVVRLTGAVAVAGGTTHWLALKADGTLSAWGGNGAGQLGDGTTTSRTTPVAVSSLANVIDISAGSQHSLAITSDRTAYALGPEPLWPSFRQAAWKFPSPNEPDSGGGHLLQLWHVDAVDEPGAAEQQGHHRLPAVERPPRALEALGDL